MRSLSSPLSHLGNRRRQYITAARKRLLGRACEAVTEVLERRVLMASIVGGIWEDANGNGTWDATEFAAPNRALTAVPFPAGTPTYSANSDSTGFYTFAAMPVLASGEGYLVSQTLTGGAYQTFPGGSWQWVGLTTDAQYGPGLPGPMAFGFWYDNFDVSLSTLTSTPDIITTDGGPLTLNRTLNVASYSPLRDVKINYYLSTDTTLEIGTDIAIGTETISAAADKAVGANLKTFNATVPSIAAGTYYLIGSVDPDNDLLEGGTAGTLESNVFVGATVSAGQLKGNVAGHVWLDANANGLYVSQITPLTLDSEESPLAGVKVYVDSTPNGVWDAGELFALTDINGDYLLTDVPTGNRTIRAEVPAGSQVVSPAPGYLSTTVVVDTTVTDQNLGIWRSAFDASWNSVTTPQSFLDIDGGSVNITRDYQLAGGPGTRSFVVEYRLSADGTWNNGFFIDGEVINTPAGQTDGSHSRAFDISMPVVAPGTYTLLVRVDSLGVMNETDETNNTFTVGTFEAFNAGSISGLVWEDDNANEIRDGGEVGAGNRRVYLDKDASGTFNPGDVETQTDATGRFTFAGLKPGNYTVLHDLAGVAQTTPISAGYSFALGAGEESTDNDFGFRDPNRDLSWTTLSTSTAQLSSIGGQVSVSRTYDIVSSPAVRDFVIQYKLSPDGDWDNATNVVLGSETITALADKSLGAHARTFTMNAPALAAVVDSLTSYTLLARIDTTATVGEANEANNTTAGNALSVYIGNEVRGSVWNDTDGDVTRDPAEPAGVGRRVFAEVVGSLTADGAYDAGEAFTMTDAGGLFALTQLAPGSYTVYQELNGGEVQVVPAPGTGYDVTLTSGTVVSDKLFGFRVPPDLSWNSLSGAPTSLNTVGGTINISRDIKISPVNLFDNFVISYRLSVDTTWSAGDFVLGSESVSAAGDKTAGDHARQFALNFGPLSAGTYYLLGRVESGDAIAESDEANNNIVANQVTVRNSAPTTTVYLSDLTPTTQTNAWGPYERDRSNGENGAADGNTITIQGVTYAKGLGVHADSVLVYNLVGGSYTKFQSDIGVDDEVGNLGSVVFQVLLDGVAAYTSSVMTGAMAAKQIDLSVVGKSTLELRVLNVDGNFADHADWANARLISDSVLPPPPPPPPPPGGTVVYLSNLTPTLATNGWGTYEKDKSNGEAGAADGNTITLNGVTYAKGLGVHADSVLRYNLAGGGYTRFRSDIGVDDEVGAFGNVVFQVWLDGVKAGESTAMTGASATQLVDIDVTGKSTLELRVLNVNGNFADHADWADARLYQDSTPDTTPPTPNPMTWAVAPVASGSSISMTATTATDINGVQYYFDETSGNPGGTDSGWQDSPSYTDTGLNPLTTYTYTVKVRDKSSNQNTGAESAPAGATTPAATPMQYLSDLTPTLATNGWGTYEKDKSNGEAGANDGHTITLNGVTYAKGLGVHAGSTLRYDLTGLGMTRFQSDIGVDDEVGAVGRVVFQVWLDGVKVYDSGAMTGTTATKAVDLNITGKSTLELRVTDGGNGLYADHADWAGAQINQTTPPPAPPTPTTTFLSDLTPTTATNGWGNYERDRSNGEAGAADGRTITLNGTTYAKGLGVHAGSVLVYSVAGLGKTRFQSDIGVDDEVGNLGSVYFQLWLDGVRVFESGRMTGATATGQIDWDITGKSTLELRVVAGGDGNYADHADWANALIS